MPRKPGAPDLSDATAVLPDDLQKVADDLGVNGEKLAQQLSATQNTLLSTDVPLSPLETMLASQLGASAWTKLTQRATVSKVREAAFAFNRFWVVDKVFSLATAATVSVDELLRIFHTYGYEATFKWMQDRATFMQAHANSLLYGKGGQRLTKGAGAARLSAKQQERLRHLSDFPNKLKAAERQMLEQHGLGWTDLTPNDMGFRDAAKQWTAGFVQDTGFRAFLRGREAFREWFTSPDGEILRRSAVTKRTEAGMRSTIVQNADDFYDGWQTLFDDVILSGARKAGKYDEVRAAWVDIAKRVDETGGLPKDLPDIAINHLDSVRGVRRDPANKINGTSLQESFFDKLFMDPVNYRRGFLADLTRTHEKSRLTSLMHSQGKRIVSDAEIESIMGLQGIAGANRTGLRSAVHDMAIRAGYMPESYLDDLVEKAVLREIDNTLYSFDSSSRLGAQSKAVFPFGKPWADMAGFWGREAVRAPVLRGWVNKTNAFGLRTLDEKGILAYSPVNKSSALISRLAHTDFTIDKGLIGGEGEGFLHEGGLIPGTESIDFSPLFFLPTAGENPMQYMIPGLGVVPIVFLDKLMESKYDPIEQPEEYQALVDEIAQFIPSAHFQQGSWQSRILGGGTTIKAITAGLDINTMLGGDPNEAVTNWLGDVSRDVDRSRELSALMADPEELELLLSATSEEMAKELFLGLSMQAEDNAASGNLAATAVRWMTPIDADFSDAVHEIQDVWLDGLQHGP
ncbi:MAG: hypothetical protein GWN58_48835, partial [Anaerolineae bacterium]|nr:hypothetical protein [Anaerolineae bacterium]